MSDFGPDMMIHTPSKAFGRPGGVPRRDCIFEAACLGGLLKRRPHARIAYCRSDCKSQESPLELDRFRATLPRHLPIL